MKYEEFQVGLKKIVQNQFQESSNENLKQLFTHKGKWQ